MSSKNVGKLLSIIIAIGLLIGLSGCAAMPNYDEFPEAPKVFPEPSEGESLIYVFREKRFIGCGVTYYVWIDKIKAGALKNGSYFFTKVSPGEHMVWAETEGKTSIILQCEPGKEYYVGGGVGMGFFIGRPVLNQVSQSVGRETVKKLDHHPLKPKSEK